MKKIKLHYIEYHLNQMINICLINHTILGKRSLLDWAEWLNINLNKNRIKFKISKNIRTDAINIIFDNFFLDTYYFLKKYNIKYGIVATEYPTRNTFNNLNENQWIERRYSFNQVAKGALFIWSMGKWVDYNKKNKIDEFMLSYTPELSKINVNKQFDKKYDFIFTGPVNSFRAKILKKFEKYSNLNVYDGFLNRKNYEKCVSEAKYYLCIQQSSDWPTISVSKMMRALHNQTIPILLNSNYLKNFKMAKFSINIDPDITETQIQSLLFDYKNNLKICSDYKNFKTDNFTKLKHIISLNSNNLIKKRNIMFPNHNLTEPTAQNKRYIKKFFKLKYRALSFFKNIMNKS